MDPITNLSAVGDEAEIKGMLTRVIDFLKNQGVTALFTSLTEGGGVAEQTQVGVSSLMDTWLLLTMVQSASERNRVLYVLKSRGMAHSNQMREFVLSSRGIDLVDVYVGPGVAHTGTERLNQEARDKAATLAKKQDAAQRARELEQDRRALEAQIAVLQAKLGGLTNQHDCDAVEEKTRLDTVRRDRTAMARAREADRRKSSYAQDR